MHDSPFKLANFVRRSHYHTMTANGDVSAGSNIAPMNGTPTSNGTPSGPGAGAGSSRKNVRCPTCQGIGWVRKVTWDSHVSETFPSNSALLSSFGS
ncbi:hypothetical protein ElyMa_000844900 [Elysia marginata]|uniref:LITAF domain-containing protein n=1 Tax=Elysia marginata TaxID=1093978 RepID=A0AAV4H397_9GAST|nr:hypothetical protein ElyMa_000844900 [Elysia marginata]